MSAIEVSKGFSRYAFGTVLELTGEDISTCTFSVAIVDADAGAPADGYTDADVDEPGVEIINFHGIQVEPLSQRVLKKFISAELDLTDGAHDLWGKVQDHPEIEPQFLCRFTTS